MATDLEKLVVQLSADIKGYEREMRKASGVSNREARAVEQRFRQMNRNLDGIGRSAARSLIAPLTGIGAALSVRAVMQYADAWTSAKNSLAVAGVVGENQADVLERLYQAAQDNAAPVGALADLFGKAAQASDNLGASQEELLRFSNGVAVSLRVAGTSATQASGSLTQLGQLLGQARVQAEEFNSINEGARPILMAVANGLDAAGGSVSRLKQLVNDGEVSGRDFFQAFLRGMPQVEKMAANATQTIDQGITKVVNAFTRYIGETDESLGASQRLVAGLSALADNFDNIADVTVKVAAIIGAGLLGRSIAGMIRTLGLGTAAAIKFTAALRTATTVTGLASAMGSLSLAAGPIGAVVGVAAAGALMLFARSSEEAETAADRFNARVDAMVEAAEKADTAIGGVSKTAEKMAEVKLAETAAAEAQGAAEEYEMLREKLLRLFEISDTYGAEVGITPEQIDTVNELRSAVEDGTLSSEQLYSALSDLQDLGSRSGTFKGIFMELEGLASRAFQAASAVARLNAEAAAAAAQAASPLSQRQTDAYKQYGQSRSEGDAMVRAGEDYIKVLDAQNDQTQEQLDLLRARNQIIKDAPSDALLTDAQIDAAARARLDAEERRRSARRSGGGSGGSKGGRAKKEEPGLFEDVETNLRDLEREILLIGKSTEEVARSRAQWALLDEAKKRGLTVTEALNTQINDQAAAVGRLTGELERGEIAQQQFDETVDGIADSLAGALVAGESLRDGLAQVFKQIAADILRSGISDALKRVFTPEAGGTSILGNLFGGLFGGFRAGGGNVQAGRAYAVNENTPNTELFVPGVSGTILNPAQARRAMGAGQAPRITINNNAPGVEVMPQYATADEVSFVVRRAMDQMDRRLPDRIRQINDSPYNRR